MPNVQAINYENQNTLQEYLQSKWNNTSNDLPELSLLLPYYLVCTILLMWLWLRISNIKNANGKLLDKDTNRDFKINKLAEHLK